MIGKLAKKLVTGMYNHSGKIAGASLVGLGAYGTNKFIHRYNNPVEPYVNEAVVNRRQITETRGR